MHMCHARSNGGCCSRRATSGRLLSTVKTRRPVMFFGCMCWRVSAVAVLYASSSLGWANLPMNHCFYGSCLPLADAMGHGAGCKYAGPCSVGCHRWLWWGGGPLQCSTQLDPDLTLARPRLTVMCPWTTTCCDPESWRRWRVRWARCGRQRRGRSRRRWGRWRGAWRGCRSSCRSTWMASRWAGLAAQSGSPPRWVPVSEWFTGAIPYDEFVTRGHHSMCACCPPGSRQQAHACDTSAWGAVMFGPLLSIRDSVQVNTPFSSTLAYRDIAQLTKS
jgi:hypothetical protein